MTNAQLYPAVGVPIIFNGLLIGFMWASINRRIDTLDARLTREMDLLKELWRSELRRLEEILDARLKHLEESK